ncbi:MAG: YdcF family protein [Erysipelotrichaceae bacterium]|nr:YdcF family protein [Erysipelotrichaceae bacterium]
MQDIIEILRVLVWFLLGSWAITLARTYWKPYSYNNSFLLLVSLGFTIVFLCGFAGRQIATAMLLTIIGFLIVLLLVPGVLMINGVVMIKKESFCFAHVLSLILGLLILIGEVANILFVYNAGFNYDTINLKYAAVLLFVSFTALYFCIIMLLFVLYVLFLPLLPHRNNFEYVIIHGCGLKNGETVTKLLANRCDKAIQTYRKSCKKPYLICSGGQGADEKISEAQAIADYCIANGVSPEHIILEDKSATTMENLINSKQIIESRGGAKRIALVSSNFHVFRCLQFAKKIKLKCTGLGGKTAWYFWPTAVIREFVAVFRQPMYFLFTMIPYTLVSVMILIALL